MRQQIIVTIGREYGSAGHYIAQQLAARMGVTLYDRALLDGQQELTQEQQAMIRKHDEKPVNRLLSRRVNGFSNSIEENLAEQAFVHITEHAQSGESFVVVGRCSEYVLRSQPNAVHFFIVSDKPARIARIMRLYGLTEKEAADKIRRHDKRRRLYHDYYCDTRWGDARAYDLCVNSATLGIEETIEVLLGYVRAFEAWKKEQKL